jgi:hypothetical protein
MNSLRAGSSLKFNDATGLRARSVRGTLLQDGRNLRLRELRFFC